MFRKAADPTLPVPKAASPLTGLFAAAGVLGVSLMIAGASLLGWGAALCAVLVFVASVAVIAQGMARTYHHDVAGLCNLVTLTRAALVAFLLGAVAGPDTSGWIVFFMALVALCLDGADGWLARRTGLESDFGARFDMETDAALAAVLSLWLLASGTTGPEILILGFMRYAFVLAGSVWPWLRRDLPEAFRRKLICVVQIAALVILSFPLVPPVLIFPLAAGASALLAWSFAVDIRWLSRRPA